MLSKEVYCNSNVYQTGVWGLRPKPSEAMGVWGLRPQPLGDLSYFFSKKAVLTPLDHISHEFRAPFKSTRFFTFESRLKKISCLVLLLLAI